MKQPLSHHVQELRRRLMLSALVVLAGSVAAYFARDVLLAWLQAPLHETLYYTKPTGAFEFLMSACLLVGVLLAIPVLIYNFVAFIQPALPRPWGRFKIIGLVGMSTILTLFGVAFAYYVSLPGVINFLGHMDVSHLHALIAADSYLKFVVIYLGVFALIFQLPLILFAIDRITPLPPSRLRRARKWVVIGAFGAALILPIAPDPVSQIMLASPIVLMYELSAAMLWFGRYRRRPAPKVDAALVTPAAALPQQRAPRNYAPKQTHIYDMRSLGPNVIDLRGR